MSFARGHKPEHEKGGISSGLFTKRELIFRERNATSGNHDLKEMQHLEIMTWNPSISLVYNGPS